MKQALRRARGGDREAFGKVYETLAPRVRGLCRNILGSADEAEDATSETFVKAQESMERYDENRPLAPWILGIASHLCIDRLRRRGVEARIFEERLPEKPGPTPLEAAIRSEERGRIREALDALPERYRIPMILRYQSHLDYESIARTLGIRKSHVATLLFRARQEIRKRLARKREGMG